MKTRLKKFYNKPVIVDANILFDLYEIEALYVLPLVFSAVYIPEEVVAELLDDEQCHEINEALDYRRVVIQTAEGYDLYAELTRDHRELSSADKYVVCNAYEKELLCISNDSGVRKACQKHDITVIRTLGVLGCAREMDLISQSELQRMFDLLLSPASSSYLTINHPDVQRFAFDFELVLEN